MKKKFLAISAIAATLFSCSEQDVYEFEIPDGYVYESADIESDVTDNNVDDEDEDGSTTTANGYKYVDLGLTSGLKWATINIGATLSADYGNYYAWGEIKTKSSYTSSNSTTYQDDTVDEFSGNATYDADTAKWGSTWRMPTYTECKEFVNECTWTWTTQKNSDGSTIKGYLVVGNNGNSIFIPAAGYRKTSSLYNTGTDGYYWSSTPLTSSALVANALIFDSSSQNASYRTRYYCLPIRPVSD